MMLFVIISTIVLLILGNTILNDDNEPRH